MALPDATFRFIPGYEGMYAVNPTGKVWSEPRTVRMGNGTRRVRGRYLTPRMPGGYPSVTLSTPGRSQSRTIKSLVYEVFHMTIEHRGLRPPIKPGYTTPSRRSSGALDVWDTIPDGYLDDVPLPLPWETS